MVLGGKRFVTVVAIVALFCGTTAWAQAPGERISGVVRDATGAAVPGVTVTVTNQATRPRRRPRPAPTAATPSTRAARRLHGRGVAARLRPPDARTSTSGASRRDAGRGLRARAAAARARRSPSPPCCASRRCRTCRSRSPRRPRTSCASAASTTSRAWPRNVAGFTVQNLGPGQSQVAMRGVSAGQIVRDQPGVKEQVGVYLDESVDLAVAVHARHRPVRRRAASRCCAGRRARCSASGSLSGTVRYITNQPELGVQQVLRRARRQLDRRRQRRRQRQARRQRAAGRHGRAARRRATTTSSAATWTPCSPTSAVERGRQQRRPHRRARGRAGSQPNERLTITPRLVYQKVEMDGWNRIDAYNILANPFTTTRPGGDARRARAVHADRASRSPTSSCSADLNIGYDFGDVDADLDHVVHRPRRPGRARRDRADRQHHRRQHRPARETSTRSTRRSTTRPTAKVLTQELRLVRRQRRGSSGWSAASTATRERDYGQSLLVSGFEDAAPASRPQGLRGAARTCCSSPTSATTSSSSRSSARRPVR